MADSLGDSLGDRMKNQYENRTRLMLPRRTYTLIRVDGKAFHTFTRGCVRPWDNMLAWSMEAAAHGLVTELQGSAFAYLQSDEISVLLTDFASEKTDAWFDGNVQKMASVSASIATACFNRMWQGSTSTNELALFDARVWTIPDPTEVANYFIWRQQDAERNSLQMLARCHYSHAELLGRNSADIHAMLYTAGVNWNDCPTQQKRGRAIVYREGIGKPSNPGWAVDSEIPVFTSEEGREWLRTRIPRYE